jgi:glycosyltransferase involved in cell wall biosynthesis
MLTEVPHIEPNLAAEPGRASWPASLYVLVPHASGAGAERVALALMEGLSRERYALTLVALAEGIEGARIPADVRVLPLRSRSFKLTLPLLVRILHSAPPDVLLSHMSLPNTWAVLARRLSRRHFPVVCVEHTVPSVAYSQGTRLQALIPRIVRAAYRSADAVVACSAQTVEDLVSTVGLPRERIELIESPVISPELERLAAEPPPHPWLLDGDIDVVLGAGRLIPIKGFALLVRAFAAVLDRHPRARLLILGEGSQRPELEGLVAELGLGDRVSLPGWAENPYSAMSRAAVFAVPSLFEGGPLTLIEAMACGARVVSTAVGVAPDVLSDESLGLLVEPGDQKALADAIVRQLQLEQPPPPAEAVSRFRYEVAVGAYDELLESLLSSSSRK